MASHSPSDRSPATPGNPSAPLVDPLASPQASPPLVSPDQHQSLFPRSSSLSGLARLSRNSGFFGGSSSPLGSTGRRGSEASLTPLGDTARAIRDGAIGGSYGPYPRHQSLSSASPSPLFSRRGSHFSTSDVAVPLFGPSSYPTTPDPSGSDLELPRVPYALSPSGSTTSASLPRFGSQGEDFFDTHNPPSTSTDELRALPRHSHGAGKPFLTGGNDAIRRSQLGITSAGPVPGTAFEPHFLWEKGDEEADDFLHEPNDEVDAILDRRRWRRTSWSAAADTLFLVIVVLVIVGLFAGWPVLRYGIIGNWTTADHGGRTDLGYGLGGINGSGQVPLIEGLPTLIDSDTPLDAYTMMGHDGDEYSLVFSDEFERDGRTFWPGDDPYWEAIDLHYWQTQDYEWYDPDALTTKDGKLVITLTQEPWNGLNFRSGFLQSWNKFCFTGGKIEVRCSFPGNSRTMGFWPGAWTSGVLGRPGFGGSNHGVWPYTYDTCDVGTLPNQTYANGTGPAAALNSGSRDYGGTLSYLPGQRLSACTCPGEDHPGPNVNVGRGAPEIDITEQQVDWRGTGSTSQSIQFAPIDAGYAWKNTSPEMTIFDTDRTVQNLFTGAVNQESASLITLTDTTSYEDQGYATFGFEYTPGADGVITWFVNNTPSWQITAAAMGPNAETEIGQRLVSVEPMSINLNLALSNAFQTPNWENLTFPGTFRVDYVRVYQKGEPNIGCDPPDYPTAAYIARNLDVYTNANYTVFPRPFPKNRMSATGCD
ncbi:hypothetical protein JCM8547_001883 [Rhodosporidiobolus lusitaniae]